MRPKQTILDAVRLEILDVEHQDIKTHWIASYLIEVLIDIRDALVTDCKDALNALIEIRSNKDDEREI